jgi:hypothetical protein
MARPLTVGKLKRLMEGLPDDAPVRPDWARDCTPDDSQPGVEITTASVEQGRGRDKSGYYLSVKVKLFYLDN